MKLTQKNTQAQKQLQPQGATVRQIVISFALFLLGFLVVVLYKHCSSGGTDAELLTKYMSSTNIVETLREENLALQRELQQLQEEDASYQS